MLVETIVSASKILFILTYFFSSFIAEIPGIEVNGLLFPLIGIGSAKDSLTNARFNMYKISDSWVPFHTIYLKQPVAKRE
jgi:hypothetical protein